MSETYSLMSETYSLRELEKLNEFVYWLFIKAVTATGKKLDELWPGGLDTNNLKMTLVVNGVELPVVETFDLMHKYYREDIKDAASCFLREGMNDFFEKLSDLESDLREAVWNVAQEKLGLVRPERENW